eukprot:11410970-Heterocapsa_arctica.AAC.1
MGIGQTMLLRLNIDSQTHIWANLFAFCGESDGDSEDARGPVKNLQKPTNTSKPYTPVCVHL